MRNVSLLLASLIALSTAAACSKDKKAPTTPPVVKEEPKEEPKSEPVLAPEVKVEPLPIEQPKVVVSIDTIYFDFDQADLRADSKDVLGKAAEQLGKDPSAKLVIAGHTDDRGTSEYNIALGDRRARAAREYLIRLGVAGARIEIISYGEERPAASGDDESAWSRNRRDEFEVK
jgi:peptidoglycan-associated lipoprotein